MRSEQRYVQEALRLRPAVAGSARRAERVVKLSSVGGEVKPGQLVWIDAAAVNRDGTVFQEPNQVNLSRKSDDYAMNERISNLASRESRCQFFFQRTPSSLPASFQLTDCGPVLRLPLPQVPASPSTRSSRAPS